MIVYVRSIVAFVLGEKLMIKGMVPTDQTYLRFNENREIEYD